MRSIISRFTKIPQSGLLIIIVVFMALLSVLAGSRVDSITGQTINNFLNPATIMQTLTDASFFAIMAIGITMVIISGGIDLSVGSTYALSGVVMAMVLQNMGNASSIVLILTAIVLCLGIGTLCGFLNGVMIVGLKVHPFIITLGTMWVFRGIAFVSSQAKSMLVPDVLTKVAKSTLGFNSSLYPVPMLIMLLMTILGEIYLLRTVMGRNVYAVGGNEEAAKYCGLRVDRAYISVYVITGLCAGIAAFIGSSFYGATSCNDANGYELYVIASAVVGGASLTGGKGSAFGACLGALLIVLIRQSIRTLHFDQNYEWIIIGCAIIIAVVLDRISSQMAAKRLARQAE